jgi:hypothetical protein
MSEPVVFHSGKRCAGRPVARLPILQLHAMASMSIKSRVAILGLRLYANRPPPPHCGGGVIYFDARGSPQSAPLPSDSKRHDLRLQYPEHTSGRSTDRCVLISSDKPQVAHARVTKVDLFVTVRPFSNNVQSSGGILLPSITQGADVRMTGQYSPAEMSDFLTQKIKVVASYISPFSFPDLHVAPRYI